MYFFTSDEHYYHKNAIRYSNRPFSSVEEMNETLISNFNSKVGKDDHTTHAGDFTLIKDKKKVYEIINRLNGTHTFLLGSHDYWAPRNYKRMFETKLNGHFIVVCHYCMRVWARSHYNSWHLYGHSHGRLEPIGKSWDIGVDNNNFYPLSFDEICEIMKHRPDNPNLIRRME